MHKGQETIATPKVTKALKKKTSNNTNVDTAYPDLWINFLAQLKPETRNIYAQIPSYLFKIYRLDQYLAKGGQGITFLAKDGMGRSVLVKIGEYNSLKSEYVALNSIKSPNIISLYLGERFGDAMVLIEEFVSGVSLNTVLQKAKQNNWIGSDTYHVFIVMVLMQIMTGLESIHHSKGDYLVNGKLEDRSFVHRDIKPDNIMLACDGTTKLIDFGLARRIESEEALLPVGFSLPFASPNQIKNQLHQPSDDYYALTIMAILLTEGGFETFYDKEDIRNILNKKPTDFLKKQFQYFVPRLDKLLPILTRVEKILKTKFIPINFKNSLRQVLEKNSSLGNNANTKLHIKQMELYQAEALDFPLAEELYNALISPFHNTTYDYSHLVKSFEIHRFMHQEFIARQTYLLKATT